MLLLQLLFLSLWQQQKTFQTPTSIHPPFIRIYFQIWDRFRATGFIINPSTWVYLALHVSPYTSLR